MSLFSIIDTRAPSTEEILAVETEYDENGKVKEPSWIDTYELETEFSLQRLSGTFGVLSVVFAVLGIVLSVWFSVSAAFKNSNAFSLSSLLILVAGLAITALVFAVLRLARAFVNYMLVRLLQNEED